MFIYLEYGIALPFTGGELIYASGIKRLYKNFAD
jgi:hypothetical protein